jgi:hypothetical protein
MTSDSRLGLKQIRTLADMPRNDMVAQIAAGLPLILQSAEELADAAMALGVGNEGFMELALDPQRPGAGRRRSVAILMAHAEEEAAKALMLVDLVRCPTRRQQDRQRLARQVYDHLARMIYSDSVWWKVASFAELRGYVEREREQFYLDGPNDVDFVYLNGLIYERESLLYADLVRWEHGLEWQRAGAPWGGGTRRGRALDLARALARVGAFEPAGLEAIDQLWNPLDLRDETHWQEVAALNRATLERLNELGLLASAGDGDVRLGLEWQMPLYPLDLRMKTTNVETLTAVRDWHVP